MAKISLNYYTFRIFVTANNKKETEYLAFDNISDIDFEKHLYNYFISTAYDYINDKNDEQLFRTTRLYTNEYTINGELYYKSVTAMIKTGAYGDEAEIVDSENTSSVKTLLSSEAPVKPFGFGVYFNPEKDTAILVTQSLGITGIGGIIKKHLSRMVKQINPDFNCEIKNVIPHSLLKKLLESEEIKQICVETYKENHYDLTDELGETTTLQTSKKTTVYTKPLVTNKNFFYKLFAGSKKLSSIAGITTGDETISNLTVKFSNKSINYNAYHSTRINEDISKHFNDSKQVDYLTLFKVMDENVIDYMIISKIIFEIKNANKEQLCVDLFYVKENEVIEKHITEHN